MIRSDRLPTLQGEITRQLAAFLHDSCAAAKLLVAVRPRHQSCRKALERANDIGSS